MIGADKGDGLTVGVAPKAKFKFSDYSKLAGSRFDPLIAAKWGKGSVAQNSWGGCD